MKMFWNLNERLSFWRLILLNGINMANKYFSQTVLYELHHCKLKVHTLFIFNRRTVKIAISLCLVILIFPSLIIWLSSKILWKIPFYDVFSKCVCSFSTSQIFLFRKPLSGNPISHVLEANNFWLSWLRGN